MSRQRYTPERFIGVLREAALAQGQTAAQLCRTLGIAGQTCWRRRREYGDLKAEQARRLQALDQEKARRQRAGANLTLAG
jgi:putative transposase